MEQKDLEYICSVIGNLASVPIRIYKDERLTYYYSLMEFVKDPIEPYLKSVLKISEHIGYFVTPFFHYYGVVNSNEFKIVLGPTRQNEVSKENLNELAFECGVDKDDASSFVSTMEAIVPLPLASVLQMLCSLNFILNHEKLSLADLTLTDQDVILDAPGEMDQTNRQNDAETIHNTFTIEETIMNFVSHGDTSALKEWCKNAPALRPGVLSKDAIRQMKNTFIVTATLVSRAAIRGGMDVNDALGLSDGYIQRSELLGVGEDIINLQFQMILDYTEKVEKIRIGKDPSKFLKDVSNYVRKHIQEPINTSALAKALYFSRTHLSTKFKEEVGMTLTDYILGEKVAEAKRYLRYSDKPIGSIAYYLGFSSQSHFANVFKKYANCSPNEYRKKHQK